MHYLKANEYYLINMVGIRKKVPGSRWSMVNYRHFDCVKRRERGGPITGDIQHSNTDVYLQWLCHEWPFVECHNIIPKQSLCLLSAWTLTWKNSTWHYKGCYIAAFYRCVFLMRLTWCDSLLKPPLFFFSTFEDVTCRLSWNHRQLTSDVGQLGLFFVCEGIIWKFYQHLPNTFDRRHRLPIVLLLTDHSIKL